MNPSGLILAGSMMLQQIGWSEAAAMVAQAVQVCSDQERGSGMCRQDSQRAGRERVGRCAMWW